MKKIAVITGASSGMGREMAFQLADRFDVLEEIWLIARRKERLEELRGQFPANIRCFALDITDEAERKQLEAALAEEKPDVKFLVNAAGFGKIGNVGDLSEADRVRYGAVKLRGAVRRDSSGASLHEPRFQDHPVCLLRSLSSPAEICHLCGDKVLCLKLQPGIEAGTEAKRHRCDSCLSWAGKNGVFRHCGDDRKDSIIQTVSNGKSKTGGASGDHGCSGGKDHFHLWNHHEGIFPALQGSASQPDLTDDGDTRVIRS